MDKIVRERTGSFYTPPMWVALSQKYLADTLGINWQDEYYVWDCAAGTGNLLAGLTNTNNIWGSTLDQADVSAMYDRIEQGANLLKNNVFQFDFLNDDFSKLPKELQEIINDEEKRKKLLVYINPPYAEGGSVKQKTGTGIYKKDVAQNKTHDKYHAQLSGANRELFAQFLARIYFEIPGCKIANFSKLKNLQSAHFQDFRAFYRAKLEKVFLVPADTFDNVTGLFPIGFFVWDTDKKEDFALAEADVYDKNEKFIGKKTLYSYEDSIYFSKWVNSFKINNKIKIGWLEGVTRNDFQAQNGIILLNDKAQMAVPRGIYVYEENLIECCVCFAVRKCIPASWLNDRDQFLYPDDAWQTDTEFHNDCLAFTLFSNNIQSKFGTNHWIPFTEREAGSFNKFESCFMPDFLKGKIKTEKQAGDALFEKSAANLAGGYQARGFSEEAKAVFDAGQAVWRYYHSHKGVNPDASLYDIREYFQGRNKKGRMNPTSNDKIYAGLIGVLREKLILLAKKIEPKVYAYGFLKK